MKIKMEKTFTPKEGKRLLNASDDLWPAVLRYAYQEHSGMVVLVDSPIHPSVTVHIGIYGEIEGGYVNSLVSREGEVVR